MEKNPNHHENLPRLNCVVGQIEGIKKMILDGRDCPDILMQIRAVRSAMKSIESCILEKHLQHCVAQSFKSDTDAPQKIAELKTLFVKYDNL